LPSADRAKDLGRICGSQHRDFLHCVADGRVEFHTTTTLDLRAKGMTLMRMPLTVWSWFITAILGLLAFGVLLSAGILLLMDRNLGPVFMCRWWWSTGR
jgi:hypothetical protein